MRTMNVTYSEAAEAKLAHPELETPGTGMMMAMMATGTQQYTKPDAEVIKARRKKGKAQRKARAAHRRH